MEDCKQKIRTLWISNSKNYVFPTDDEEKLLALRNRWDTSIYFISKIDRDKFPKCETIINRWFNKLCDLHSEPDRYYHTLCHLEEMFALVDILLTQLKEDLSKHSSCDGIDFNLYTGIVHQSIFFHDAIYNAKSATNEEDSAALFKQFAQELSEAVDDSLTISKEIVMIIDKFIIATKSHVLDEDMNDVQIEFLKIFLDADMAVLGKQSDAYNYYAAMIRKEYQHVPRDVYCTKRAEILESFVGKIGQKEKTVFTNKYMLESLENRAVENLKNEISILKSGCIPDAC